MHYTYLILRKKKTERFCSVLWWTRLKIFSQRTLIAAGCHFQKFPETVWGPHLHHLPLRLLVFATDLHSRIKAESRELWVGVWVFYLRKNKLRVPLVDSQITSYLKELGKAPIFPLKKNTTHTYSDLRSCCSCDYSQVFFLFLFFAFPHNSTTLGEVYFNSR